MELPRVMPWTGIPNIDMAVQNEGVFLSRLFSVAPAGGFFDDAGAPNAFATPESLFTNSIDGSVILGMSLLQQEIARDGGYGFSVAAIMAHEFAHVRQFKDARAMEVAVPVRELHADFLAGWYLAQRLQVAPTDVRSSMSAFFSLGDYAFNEPQHHGTPEQRLGSLLAGMNAGMPTVSGAHEAGWRHVESLLGVSVDG
jgi:hypothetical protein